MSDPSLSDIDFKKEWLGSELPLKISEVHWSWSIFLYNLYSIILPEGGWTRIKSIIEVSYYAILYNIDSIHPHFEI